MNLVDWNEKGKNLNKRALEWIGFVAARAIRLRIHINGIMNDGCCLFAFVRTYFSVRMCVHVFSLYQWQYHAENNRHSLLLCFINEITNVNRFIHRHSAVAYEYKLSSDHIVCFHPQWIYNKIFVPFGRRRCQQSTWLPAWLQQTLTPILTLKFAFTLIRLHRSPRISIRW